MAADNERILNGEPVREESKNEVKDVPDNFKEWVRENEDRIERAKVLPMFLRDNKEYSSQRKVNWACVGGGNEPDVLGVLDGLDYVYGLGTNQERGCFRRRIHPLLLGRFSDGLYRNQGSRTAYTKYKRTTELKRLELQNGILCY